MSIYRVSQCGRRVLACAVAAVVMTCATAHAAASSVTYDFGKNITGNTAANAAAGNQFSMTVSQEGTSENGNALVSFLFSNAGPTQSSVTHIYFYKSELLGAAQGINGNANVDFEPAGSDTGPLPGAEAYGLPDTDNVFAAKGASAGESAGGIGVGQSIAITFELVGGASYADIIASIENGFNMPLESDGDQLIVGLYVQAFEDGGAESFVVSSIPLPTPVWMGLTGLIAVVVLGRRRV